MLQGLYSQGDSDKPCVLLFFGNGDRLDNYAFLAQALTTRRIGLLAISYRGYPGSTGSPSEQGLLTDGIAAFDWLSAHGGSEIIVLGRSLGTGVAVNTAAKSADRGRHSGVSVPVGTVGCADALSVPPGRGSSQGSLSLGPQHRQSRTTEVVPPRPKLDDSIPLSSGQALYRMAPEPKRMLIYDGAGHNDILNDRMVGDVIRFVEALQGNRP